MKNNPALTLLLLAGSGLVCFAQTVEDLNISKRSTFDATVVWRDPFQPIGWNSPSLTQATTPGAPAAPPTTESYIRPEAFVVSSILFDKIPLAVVNGKAYGEGELIQFNAGGKQIKIQVYAIRDGAVTLQYNDLKVVCPIRIWQKPATPKK